MDADFLTELLAGRHFNMEERRARGAWPHAPLSLRDLTRHLARVIESRTWFPRPWVPRRPDRPRFDRLAIERRGPNLYIAHYEQAGANMNLVADGERVFESAEDAAGFYLRTEFRLPGDLDGWEVID